ncbi:MAG: hypothetical protein Q4F57_00060 [Weeksellaceae bacterium]|nr:hypothetical protein [Weeksellaceae bacterium]
MRRIFTKFWIIIPILGLLFFSSCRTFLIETALMRMGAFDEKVSYSSYAKGDKSVVIYPNIHLALPEQFENLEHRLDSLFQKNYFLYYEGTTIYATDTVARAKIQVISGAQHTSKNHKELLDELLNHRRSKTNRLIMQPSFEQLGATEENSANLDMPVTKMIAKYEERFGEIVLTDCELNQIKDSRIKCKKREKIPLKQYDEIMVNERDRYIIEKMLEGDKNKVVMVYGKGHYPSMHRLLVENGYQIIDSLRQ